jgi:hypothetical protein
MTQFLIITGVIIALFVLAAARERYRDLLLDRWMARRPEAKRHRWVTVSPPPEFPAPELLEKFLGRPPIGYASAIEIPVPGGVLWVVEYRTTPLGAKTDQWFTLVARRFPDPDAARVAAGEEFLTSGPWACLQLRGLMTPSMLDGLPELLSL